MFGAKTLLEQQRKLIDSLSADREKLVAENQSLRDALGGILQAMQRSAASPFPEAHSAVPAYGVPESEPASFDDLLREAQRIVQQKQSVSKASEAIGHAFAPGMEA